MMKIWEKKDSYKNQMLKTTKQIQDKSLLINNRLETNK